MPKFDTTVEAFDPEGLKIIQQMPDYIAIGKIFKDASENEGIEYHLSA